MKENETLLKTNRKTNIDYCSKCKGWALKSFAFCPHCGRKFVEENNKNNKKNGGIITKTTQHIMER